MLCFLEELFFYSKKWLDENKFTAPIQTIYWIIEMKDTIKTILRFYQQIEMFELIQSDMRDVIDNQITYDGELSNHDLYKLNREIPLHFDHRVPVTFEDNTELWWMRIEIHLNDKIRPVMDNKILSNYYD